eukprot:RCo036472
MSEEPNRFAAGPQLPPVIVPSSGCPKLPAKAAGGFKDSQWVGATQRSKSAPASFLDPKSTNNRLPWSCANGGGAGYCLHGSEQLEARHAHAESAGRTAPKVSMSAWGQPGHSDAQQPPHGEAHVAEGTALSASVYSETSESDQCAAETQTDPSDTELRIMRLLAERSSVLALQQESIADLNRQLDIRAETEVALRARLHAQETTMAELWRTVMFQQEGLQQFAAIAAGGFQQASFAPELYLYQVSMVQQVDYPLGTTEQGQDPAADIEDDLLVIMDDPDALSEADLWDTMSQESLELEEVVENLA